MTHVKDFGIGEYSVQTLVTVRFLSEQCHLSLSVLLPTGARNYDIIV